ncbi:MAG TPA: VLRF1 family aeRF1-type release factor [Actinomycetota bacterium]|nr:VLRF1 family aeRF1-type release factor [Actinomycetota bacterium]
MDRDIVRGLAAWDTNDLPVTTLYLDADGRRFPRRGDLVRRGEDLARRACDEVDRANRAAYESVCRDVQRISEFLGGDLDRTGPVRGLALFACSGAGLWQAVPLSQPVRDRLVVGPRPHLVPLEAVLEMAETFCTAIVDREKARIFLSSLAEIEEVSPVLDDVPGQHDQGGWAQARLQRHIEEHVQRHLKRVAEALLRLHQRRRFDHLILAGPEETVAELERELHDYVARRIVDRTSLSMASSAADVLDHALGLERDLEERREREAVRRVAEEARAGTGRAVAGMAATLAALEENRVDTLVVRDGLEVAGVRCPSCGHLAVDGERCEACGEATQGVPDLVEEAVEAGLRQRSRVETVRDGAELERSGGIGALLRF